MRLIVKIGAFLCVLWMIAITSYLLASRSKVNGMIVATGLQIIDGRGRVRLMIQANEDSVRMDMLRPDGSTGVAIFVNEFDEEYVERHSHPDLFPDVALPIIQIGAGTEGAGAVIAGKQSGVPRYARAGMFGDGSTRLLWVSFPDGRGVMRLPGYATSLSAEANRIAPAGLWVAIDAKGRVLFGEAAQEAIRSEK